MTLGSYEDAKLFVEKYEKMQQEINALRSIIIEFTSYLKDKSFPAIFNSKEVKENNYLETYLKFNEIKQNHQFYEMFFKGGKDGRH